MRQALQLLSEEPDEASGRTAARDDPPSAPAVLSTAAGEDDDTTPLPVILPGAAPGASPEVHETPRGPFEPARAAPSASVDAPLDAVGLEPEGGAGPAPEDATISAEAEPAETSDNLPAAAAEKLDQIKDLLITAEAIGEANLDRHFDRVSQRQRELIREFFERAIPGREPDS